jgi:DNA replication protein DnaC
MERYLSYLGEYKAPQRYRVEKFTEGDVKEALINTYQWHVAATAKEYDTKIAPFIEKAAKWLCGNYKPGLLLYGTIGSGKTTLYNSIIKYLAITEPSMEIRTYQAIALTRCFTDRERAQEIKTVAALFIDDLGEEPVTVKDYGNEVSPVIETLYYRYEKRMFTVITTNKTEKEIREIYGARIEDRIKEMFDRIYFNNESYRK